MHITHLSESNLYDPDIRSGTPFWVSKSLSQVADVNLYNMYIKPERQQLPGFQEALFQCKSYFYRLYKQMHFSPGYSLRHALYFAKNINKVLKTFKTDVILTSLTPYAGAFLETRQPIVYWTDAVFAGIAGLLEHLMVLHPESVFDAHDMTNACLFNAKQLIFSSEWGARDAVESYGIKKDKIHVVPFGANLDIHHTLVDIKNILQQRLKQKHTNILFVGKNWYQKGGDIVLRIVNALNKAGHPTQITIVGCKPEIKSLPSYVTIKGLLSKKSAKDLTLLENLYRDAHFLFVPSRAEAFGIVFCEANSFAVPCITTYVGGIPDVVKDHINGMKFSLEASIANICDYITNLMGNPDQYHELALSSFNEYETRLNWKVASQQVKKIIANVL